MTRENLPHLLDEISTFRTLLNDFNCPVMTHQEMSGLSLYEDDDHIYLEAAVPGIKSEQIQLSVEKGVVWIKAENAEEKKNMKVHFQSARRFGYRVPLPGRIDENGTPEAICKDGILKVTFCKSRSAKSVKIAVKSS